MMIWSRGNKQEGLNDPVSCQKLEQQEDQQCTRQCQIIEMELPPFTHGGQHEKGRKHLQDVARQSRQREAACYGEEQNEQVADRRVKGIGPHLSGKTPGTYKAQHDQYQHQETHAQIDNVMDGVKGEDVAVQDDQQGIEHAMPWT